MYHGCIGVDAVAVGLVVMGMTRWAPVASRWSLRLLALGACSGGKSLCPGGAHFLRGGGSKE